MNDVPSIPGMTSAAREWRRTHGRRSHRVDSSNLEADAHMDLAELFGESSKSTEAPRRYTDQHVLIDEPARILDEMLERHGLKRILATLRSLCDSRCDNGLHEGDELLAVLDAEENNGKWRAAADALEKLADSNKVDVE